jgi:hypothetical protein
MLSVNSVVAASDRRGPVAGRGTDRRLAVCPGVDLETAMSDLPPEQPGTVRIVQGHPTGSDPSLNKGGEDGSPKPDGRSAAGILREAGLEAEGSAEAAAEAGQVPTPSNSPPSPHDAGFGRDKDLENDRGDGRAAEANLDATEPKADERPVIHYAPDPRDEA